MEDVYPACKNLMSPEAWSVLKGKMNSDPERAGLAELIRSLASELELPEYLADLAELEAATRSVSNMKEKLPDKISARIINPSLQIINVNWKGLTGAINNDDFSKFNPEKGQETVLIWYDPAAERVRVRRATDAHLLALKITAEGLHIGRTALEHGAEVAGLHQAVDKAGIKGLILGPETRIKRDPGIFVPHERGFNKFLTARVFTLQWHITQACELNCRHCYDRSSRKDMPLEQAFFILDELERFCGHNHARAKVTFTGGNPLLYPHFNELYLETVKRGFPVNILGNPAPRQRLEELCAIQKPSLYQLSLEGLPEHNDYVRQKGYFERVLNFLPVLKDLGIHSQIMLTLTRENMNQVLPLGELLKDQVDIFTFNRLSAVGGGADLLMPAFEDYRVFLGEYMREMDKNPVLGLKDNLKNIVREENGGKLFGGCTGFGCGAGFNFVTLLSDGEVHACRKFPSYMGNIFQEGLIRAYRSKEGQKYRSGSAACRGCRLLPACGGCQAVIYSLGLDPSRDRDPYCFYSKAPVAEDRGQRTEDRGQMTDDR